MQQALVASVAVFHPISDPLRIVLLGAALFVASRALRWLDALSTARDLRRATERKLAIEGGSMPEMRLRPEVRLRRDARPSMEFPEHAGSD